MADRVVIVDAGQTLQTGEPARVFASPRNARVAELVGIQNHFAGRFFKGDRPGWGRLCWEGSSAAADTGTGIEPCSDKNKIDNDTRVTWVLNGEQVDVLADGALPWSRGRGGCHTRLRCQFGWRSCRFGRNQLVHAQVPQGLPRPVHYLEPDHPTYCDRSASGGWRAHGSSC